jgi:tRNA(Arg) A34 adenosine deaminase TadA
MRYALDRARGQFELAATVNACPMCLGDLVRQTDISGLSYVCIQCQTSIPAPRPHLKALPSAIISTLTHQTSPVQAA